MQGEDSWMDEATPEERRFQERIVPLLCFIIFFSVLNGTMFNVAVPDIAHEFRLGPADVSWVLTGYIAVFALASVLYGKLADHLPVRNLITFGLLLFNAGALAGFLSHHYLVLVGARLLQASGGGAIPALSMLVATRYFPAASRGRVLGAVASTVAFAAGVGPIVGGMITSTLHWRYLFLLSAATLAAVPLLRRLLPSESSHWPSFDFKGAFQLGGAVGFLLLFVTRAVPWSLAAGLFLLALFVRQIRRSANPFMDPRLFSNRLYRYGLITTFLTIGATFGMFFAVPLMLRQLNGLDSWNIGLVIFPGAMSAALLGRAGGSLADRVGSEFIVRTGLGLLFAGHLLLAYAAGSAPVSIAACLIVGYTGFAFVQSSLAKTVSTTLDGKGMGVGMGFYNLIFFTSGAFGAAAAGKILDLAGPASFLPFLREGAAPYSNLFMLFTLAFALAAVFFQTGFRASRSSAK
jgi:MFS transporter, DHA2 family, metal-tetracycline-proton antiporter